MGVDVRLPLLESVRIASPCDARWEDMTGDERRRRCAQCDLDVHNIAALTREEAEAVLAGALEGKRVCAQLYRRADGTIITKDCPVGLAKLRRRARSALVRVGAVVGLACGAGAAASGLAATGWGERVRLRACGPFSRVCDWLAPLPAMPMAGALAIRGDVLFVPPPPAVPPAPPVAGTPPGGGVPAQAEGGR